VYAGRECARALAKGSLSFKDCTADLSGCSEDEVQRLEQELDRIKGTYDEIGKVCCGVSGVEGGGQGAGVVVMAGCA
jgi:hypothetical protein